MLITKSAEDTEKFAIATQFYVRLRRINGRVIDVQYMMENQEYARYVMDYAEDIIDNDLRKHLDKLKDLYIKEKQANYVGTENSPYNNLALPHEQPAQETQKTNANHKATWFLG